MGTPVLTPPVEFGDDCSSCTPALWATGFTPKHVYCYFEGLVGCNPWAPYPPNGKTFKLTQSDLVPCRWDCFTSIWNVHFYAKEAPHNHSRVLLTSKVPLTFFDGTDAICPPDLSTIHNDQLTCVGANAAKSGHCLISYMDVVTYLAVELGLQPGPDLYSEFFLHPDGSVVLKYCNRVLRINITVKL